MTPSALRADDDGFGGIDAFRPRAAPKTGRSRGQACRRTALRASADDSAPQDIDMIRQEGLTGRQLRMARRLAQKHGLPATSDFDAVRLLRNAGIDPFQANSVLELVSAGGGGLPAGQRSRALALTPGGDGVRLPQTIKPDSGALDRAARRDRRISPKLRRFSAISCAAGGAEPLMLMARLSVFVLLPTLLAGIYYYADRHALLFHPRGIRDPAGRFGGHGPGRVAERVVLCHLAGFDRGAGLSAIAGRHGAAGCRQGLSRAFLGPRH